MGRNLKLRRPAGRAAGIAAAALLVGCESGTPLPPMLVIDAGNHQQQATPHARSEATVDASSSQDASSIAQLQAAALPTGRPPAGQLLLTASGESLAVTGYNFPAVSPGDRVFADGWEVRFEHVIVTFDQVRLWQNPDRTPTRQQDVGMLVAELDGPWAVDLSQAHSSWPYLDGKEPGERAVAFAVLENQNKNGNQPFPTDGTRLAIGFSDVVATPSALNVNLGPDGLQYYAQMIQQGCVGLYVGQATWRGNQAPGRCTAAAPLDAAAEVGVSGGTGQEPEFSRIPTTIHFDLCFKPRAALPAGAIDTSYINCQNADNGPTSPQFTGETYLRGVAFATNQPTVGEVTFHTDHPFWESTAHDTPAHFDQFAARTTSEDGGIAPLHLEDTIGVDYTAFADRQGNVLPWRICDPNYAPSNAGTRVGQMSFDPVSVPRCTSGDPGTGLCDYYDFSKYDQSTQGHWNGADGLCYVARQYPSPP